MLLYLGLPVLFSIPSSLALNSSLIREDPAEGYALLAVWSAVFYALIVAPVVVEFVRVSIIRRRQFLADADAVLLTRSAEPLAAALTKMDAVGSRGLNAPHASAHLWTVDPLDDSSWWDRIWPSCHPSVHERVDRLAGMGGGIPQSVLARARSAGEQFVQRRHAKHAPKADGDLTATTWDDADSDPPLPAEPIAYRLTAPTTSVFEQPDASSRVVERLPAGALVTVGEAAGRFLAVITQHEHFGYIAVSAPRVALTIPGAGESR